MNPKKFKKESIEPSESGQFFSKLEKFDGKSSKNLN